MGSACCVALRDRALPSRSGGETLNRNVVYSPSWSSHWDNRSRVAGEIENHSYRFSHEISGDGSMEMKGELSSDRGIFSGGGSPLESFRTPMSQKSPVHEALGANLITPPSDLPVAGIDSIEVQNSTDSPEIVNTSAQEISYSVPSSSSFLTPTADPLYSQTRSLPANSSRSRRARRSPGHQLLRQVSDSQIPGLKSPVSEGRPSFVLSTCSNDLATGSHCGSSDGWSMRTFSELVASSQRERWSFDSECVGSVSGKLGDSSSRFSYSPSIDMQTCGACSKALTERSPWSSQKIIASNELSVIAVLVCGHVYHAECLEAMTPQADQYDPSCPTCTIGKKQMSKMSRKVLRAEAELKPRSNKISRNRVMDSYLDAGFDVLDRRKNIEGGGKVPKMEPSSSGRSSFAKPFLRRHFSLGSKWNNRSLSESDTSRKKWFWARSHKD